MWKNRITAAKTFPVVFLVCNIHQIQHLLYIIKCNCSLPRIHSVCWATEQKLGQRQFLFVSSFTAQFCLQCFKFRSVLSQFQFWFPKFYFVGLISILMSQVQNLIKSNNIYRFSITGILAKFTPQSCLRPTFTAVSCEPKSVLSYSSIFVEFTVLSEGSCVINDVR